MLARSFAIGKVPPETLVRTVYSHTGRPNPRLVVGPGIGRDVAAIRYDRMLILTTDPVTGTSSRIGEHSVFINANDIATAGARPVWYVCTILLPIGASERDLSAIMRGIDGACRRLGVTVVRGHTEVTRGLDRPIIAGFMIGERPGRLLRAEDTRAGDMVLLTKTAGIEGTAIIASDYAHRLKMPARVIRTAGKFSNQIAIVEEALSVSKVPGVRVLHDPTEGGVLNACWELGEAANLGLEIWADRIPVAEETLMICSKLRLDPLKLMSSGCLLTVVSPRSVDRVVETLEKLRVRVSMIGRMRRLSDGRHYTRHGKRKDLVAVPKDELYRLS